MPMFPNRRRMSEVIYPIHDIPLTRGKMAKVSHEDFEFVSRFHWQYSKRGYAVARIKGKLVPMHRLIMSKNMASKLTSKQQCDHINHNRLDNRRSNLRIVTNQQNCFNTSKIRRRCSSIYKGVCLSVFHYKSKSGEIRDYHRWTAYITKDGKRQHIGCFDTEKEAALAYNRRAASLFGDYANLNAVV